MKTAPPREVRKNEPPKRKETQFVSSAMRRLTRFATEVIERIEDYLLERSPRFRKMLDKVRRERHSISLAEYRMSRGI